MSLNPNHWQDFFDCGCIMRINKDQYLIGWGIRTWHQNIIHVSKPHFYFPDFFLSNSTPWFQHENTAILNVEELIRLLPEVKKQGNVDWKNPYRSDFEKTFSELKILFSQGILKKAVPYVFEESHIPIKILTVLKKIITYTLDVPLHVYGFWSEKEGILGATPEILFKYKDKGQTKIETCAVAGTKKNPVDPEVFIKDSKEILEHQLVVEGICQSLKHFGEVKTGNVEVLKLPRLCHLMTPIEVETSEDVDFLSIVKALHPTPALGSFPKEEGMKWLKSYQQKIRRERYGAPLGYILPGQEAKCLVGIRNVQWNTRGAKIGAGCGVIAESQLSQEWQEICLKIASIKEMMDL